MWIVDSSWRLVPARPYAALLQVMVTQPADRRLPSLTTDCSRRTGSWSPFWNLATISLLLGFVTLLYLYIEVQRRLGEPDLAFARARQIFLLGVVQAFGAGLLITGLTGGYMASRNWSAGQRLPVESLRETLPAFVGELPRIVGVEPFYTFPAAIFVMVFFSFFIGTFLQLLWEDMPITEPL